MFEIGTSNLQVRNPEFLKVCFAGDYVYALEDARKWFSVNEAEFMRALDAAGGRGDTFNGERKFVDRSALAHVRRYLAA